MALERYRLGDSFAPAAERVKIGPSTERGAYNVWTKEVNLETTLGGKQTQITGIRLREHRRISLDRTEPQEVEVDSQTLYVYQALEFDCTYPGEDDGRRMLVLRSLGASTTLLAASSYFYQLSLWRVAEPEEIGQDPGLTEVWSHIVSGDVFVEVGSSLRIGTDETTQERRGLAEQLLGLID